ncbi:uncharacterized protein VP01_3992g3 [Puccinia sorghi]|uniref:Uncharacterized protein n=1 Tax=Puccinia sorghi TaxID=27349 RepID=A0A0L6US45_9BASI|nr:uncharacterized protein VP01_3992g3 [Puccinia sorghi]
MQLNQSAGGSLPPTQNESFSASSGRQSTIITAIMPSNQGNLTSSNPCVVSGSKSGRPGCGTFPVAPASKYIQQNQLQDNLSFFLHTEAWEKHKNNQSMLHLFVLQWHEAHIIIHHLIGEVSHLRDGINLKMVCLQDKFRKLQLALLQAQHDNIQLTVKKTNLRNHLELTQLRVKMHHLENMFSGGCQGGGFWGINNGGLTSKKLAQLPAVDMQNAPAKLSSKLHLFAYVDVFCTVTVHQSLVE